MERYHFHLRDHVDQLLDPEGLELDGLGAVKTTALEAARDLISGDVMTGRINLHYRIDVEDASGALIYSLPFEHAVSIIPQA